MTDKDPLDAIIEKASGVQPSVTTEPAGEAEPETTQESEFELPKHWSEEERAKWGAVPPEHRALLADARKSIEAGYNTKSQKLSDKARFWKDIKKSFSPLDPLLKQTGATKLQTIRNLVGNYVGLVQQPDAAFEHLARSFAASRSDQERQAILARFARGLGIHPGAAQKPQAQEDYLDPVAGQKIARLEQALAQLTQGFTQQTAYSRQAAVTQAEQMIQGFAKDNPDFEAVRGDVEILLGSPKVPQHLPPAERLKLAYEIACRMNPEVFEKIETARKAEKAKQEAEARRKEVDKSKQAARNPEGQFVSTSAATKTAKRDLDTIIRNAAGATA